MTSRVLGLLRALASCALLFGLSCAEDPCAELSEQCEQCENRAYGEQCELIVRLGKQDVCRFHLRQKTYEDC